MIAIAHRRRTSRRRLGMLLPFPWRGRGRFLPRVLIIASLLGAGGLTAAPEATAFNPIKPICGVAGWVSGIVGKACNVVQHGGKLIGAGKKLLGGHLGGAAQTLFGGGSAGAGQVIGLAALVAWVSGGAKVALDETAKVLDRTTRPELGTTWFSSTYWRMAGISALLTLPFLFAAAIQALLHSDLTLLLRAALGYLPLSMLAVGVAAPVTMLLLAASDEMSAIVSSAAGQAGTRFLSHVGLLSGALSTLARSPFLVFLIGLLTAAGAIVLWVEMLMRQAAIYIVVLLLPLAFAALVWPARRVWAIRAVELLVALILSKFVIVAVLSLGGAALGHGGGVAGGMLAGLVLVLLGAVAPWALLRLLPLTELASGAAAHLRSETSRLAPMHATLNGHLGSAGEWATSVAAGMRRAAAETDGGGAGMEASAGALPGPGALPAPGAVSTAGREVSTDEAIDDPAVVAEGGDGGTPAKSTEGSPNGSEPRATAVIAEAAPAVTTAHGAESDPAPYAPTDTSDLDELRERVRETLILGPEPLSPDAEAPRTEAAGGATATGGATAAGAKEAAAAEDHDPRPPASDSEETPR